MTPLTSWVPGADGTRLRRSRTFLWHFSPKGLWLRRERHPGPRLATAARSRRDHWLLRVEVTGSTLNAVFALRAPSDGSARHKLSEPAGERQPFARDRAASHDIALR